MKVVIFRGSRSARLSAETKVRPKPMVKIGNKSILCHIVDIYQHYGKVFL